MDAARVKLRVTKVCCPECHGGQLVTKKWCGWCDNSGRMPIHPDAEHFIDREALMLGRLEHIRCVGVDQ
jgi:hypothetical protein